MFPKQPANRRHVWSLDKRLAKVGRIEEFAQRRKQTQVAVPRLVPGNQ